MARANDQVILDELFKISGRSDRTLSDSEYKFIRDSLLHEEESIRERAVFIGGMRIFDPIFLGFFLSRLVLRAEPSLENRRLMIECLVSSSLRKVIDSGALSLVLQAVLQGADENSLEAKAAYIGIKRLNGEMSTSEFAVLDYDDVRVQI